jgi:hypothetical protein
MNFRITIRSLFLILILTMLFYFCVCSASASEFEKTTFVIEETISLETVPEIAESVKELKPAYIKKDVPLYNQRDYTETPYGSSSIAKSGCGITSASMVISYFAGRKITPDILAPHYNLRTLTFQQRMLKALDDCNIKIVEEFYGKKQWPQVYKALEEGYLVISYQSPGFFTEVGHFLVLTGLTEDGKVWINDPNGDNLEKNDVMIDGFTNGFDPDLITNSGGIYYVLEYTGSFISSGIKPSPFSYQFISFK